VKRVLCSLAGLLLALTCLQAAPPDAPRKAPELAFTLSGEGQKLLSQYRGKVVALEFILTTCPHCQAASRVMTGYQKEFGPRGFQAIDLAINALDEGNDARKANALVANFIQTYQVGFPVGWLPREQMTSFMAFSIIDRMVVPQLALIDRKGFIRYQTPATSGPEWDEVMNEANIRKRIEELLAAGNATPSTTVRRTKTTRTALAKKGS
jgi:thiol-disulfide isomerase/thioredoxin